MKFFGSLIVATSAMLLLTTSSSAVPSTEEMQRIFESRATALQEDFTLRYAVRLPPNVKWNGESEKLRLLSVLTLKDGIYSVLMQLDPDTPAPTYPEFVPTPNHFDSDSEGNLLILRPLERLIMADKKIQVQQNSLARFVVSPAGEAGFEREPQSTAHPASKQVAHRDDPTHFLDLHRPLIAAGIGHFLYVTKITHVSEQDGDSGLLYCEGLGQSPASTSNEDHIWKMVLDPDKGYLLKSAQIVGPKGETIFSEIANEGVMGDDGFFISESSTYTPAPQMLHLLKQQLHYTFESVTLSACEETTQYIAHHMNLHHDTKSGRLIIEDKESKHPVPVL